MSLTLQLRCRCAPVCFVPPRQSNVIAARSLGDAYAQALTKGKPESDGDLFGREILWRRAAAASGQPEDEIRLAQAFDFDRQVNMPDQALAYYTRRSPWQSCRCQCFGGSVGTGSYHR
jgi:hypothetical protein